MPGVWAWDHFVGQGDRTVPVVEGWTILVDGRRGDAPDRPSGRS